MTKIKEIDWRDGLEGDLRKIMNKYGLAHSAFSSVKTSTDEQIGIYVTDKTTTSFAQSVFAVGKLWQHGREEIRKLLNSFDTWGGKP